MDSSPPSEVDYAERVAASNNRIDIEMSIQPTDNARYKLSQPIYNDNETVPIASCQTDPSTMPISPLAIPYKANVLANLNLWDGHFGLISLFSTNEFLQNNTRNISYSLICIAEFIKQRCITNRDGNKIPQLDTFGEAAFSFILTIHEVGWDKLNTLDKTTIKHKIKAQFVESAPPSLNPSKSNLVEKIPPSIPTYLPCK